MAQVKLEHRVGVPASSKAIWDVLSDLGRWHEWNSVYPKIEGLLRIQQRLTIVEAFPSQPHKIIRPMVVDWVPNEQILWSFGNSFVKRLRYIEIEHLNDEDTSCVLSNGEVWDGLFGGSIAKRNRKVLRRGYEQLNDDIVARVKAVAEGRAVAEGDRG